MTTIDEQIERLNAALMSTDGTKTHDPDDVLAKAVGEDAIKRLGEMRLLVLWPEGVLGITDLGRSVLISLLYVVENTAPSDLDPKMRDALLRAAVLASRISTVNELPEDLQQQLHDFAASYVPEDE